MLILFLTLILIYILLIISVVAIARVDVHAWMHARAMWGSRLSAVVVLFCRKSDWESDSQFVFTEGGPWEVGMKPRTEAGVEYCAGAFGGSAAVSGWKVPMVAAMTQPNARLLKWLEEGVNEFLRSPVVAGRYPGKITQWPPHPKMISVAIRWGDKIVDSDLHAVSRCVRAPRAA